LLYIKYIRSNDKSDKSSASESGLKRGDCHEKTGVRTCDDRNGFVRDAGFGPRDASSRHLSSSFNYGLLQSVAVRHVFRIRVLSLRWLLLSRVLPQLCALLLRLGQLLVLVIDWFAYPVAPPPPPVSGFAGGRSA